MNKETKGEGNGGESEKTSLFFIKPLDKNIEIGYNYKDKERFL